MPHHLESLRIRASECLALAQTTTDLRMRAALLIMAKKLNGMTIGPTNFHAGVRQFNDEEMSRHLGM
jgi:hypothetical protein